MTVANDQLRAALKNPHKYRAKPCIVDGIRFASTREATYYADLKLLERAGKISHLSLQVPFELRAVNHYCGGYDLWVVVGKYIPDFCYLENGRKIAVDVKGASTPVFKLKAKIFRANYPDIELRIVK